MFARLRCYRCEPNAWTDKFSAGQKFVQCGRSLKYSLHIGTISVCSAAVFITQNACCSRDNYFQAPVIQTSDSAIHRKNIIRRKSIRITDCTIHWIEIYPLDSLRSRSLEVVGERENGRARGRHARGVSSRARFFLCPSACYAGFPLDSVIHLLNNWTQFNKACRSVTLHARLCIDSALWKSCNYWFPRTHNDAQWTCSSGTTHLQPCSGR